MLTCPLCNGDAEESGTPDKITCLFCGYEGLDGGKIFKTVRILMKSRGKAININVIALTFEEAFGFVEKHNLRVDPLIVKCDDPPGYRKKHWHVGQTVLSSNGWTNISNWLVKGKTALEAISITKSFIETGENHKLYNEGVLNKSE